MNNRNQKKRKIYAILIFKIIEFYDLVVVNRSINKTIKKQLVFNTYKINIFDVGANRGQWLSQIRKLIPDSNVYAFEPNTLAFEKLQQRHGKYINAFNLALSRAAEKSKYYESPHTELSTLSVPNIESKYLKLKLRILGLSFDEMYFEKMVITNTIDNFLVENEIELIHILKIDVEGGELGVLQGAVEALKKGRIQLIIFEQHFNDQRKMQLNEIRELLISCGYIEIRRVQHLFGKYSEIIFKINK